jgi:hypothetical protein
MRAAFGEFCAEKADLVLEESLSMRSLERTVETVLLTAVEALSPGAPRTPTNECERLLAGHMSATEGISPEYCFAWRYATGWLAAAHRVAPPAARPEGILILDATSALSMDALHVQALELFLRRASLRVLALPVELQPTRLTTALRALSPTAIVLGGAPDSLDVFGRLVYIARQSLGDVEVLDYRGAVPDTGASTIGRLGDTPGQAVERLGATLASIAANTATSRSGRFVRAERAAGLAGPSDRAAVPSGDGVTVAG